MLSELWFDFMTWKRHSSFFQWLLGVALLIAVGLVLNQVAKKHHDLNPNAAITANVCLAAAGTDLKLGESLYREMASSRSHECKDGKVSR
jgi:uncharacterized membrane protein